MKKLSDIDDKLGVALQFTPDSGSNALGFLGDEDKAAMAFILAFAAMIVLSLLGVIFQSQESREELAQQVFHPVSTPKFVIMSLISLGMYQYFWIYKNWRWVRDHQEQNLMPLPRSFFMNIMNFNLFPRMSETGDPGYSWFGPSAIPLAIGILITSIAAQIFDSAPLLLFVPLLLLIPVAMQVLKLNERHPDAVSRNSKFGMPAILFIIGWTPLFLLVVLGSIGMMFGWL